MYVCTTHMPGDLGGQESIRSPVMVVSCRVGDGIEPCPLGEQPVLRLPASVLKTEGVKQGPRGAPRSQHTQLICFSVLGTEQARPAL